MNNNILLWGNNCFLIDKISKKYKIKTNNLNEASNNLLNLYTNANIFNKQNVSFDFDGVLHKSVKYDSKGQRYYANGRDWTKWKPNKKIFNEMKKEYEKCNEIYIITQRSIIRSKLPVLSFIKHNNLDKYISDIVFAGSNPKSKYLEKYKIDKHYEDSPSVIREIKKNTNCKIVQVLQ